METPCSVRGCANTASRRCPRCTRALCRECWCEHEVELARARLQSAAPRPGGREDDWRRSA